MVNKYELRSLLKTRNRVVDEVEFQHSFTGVNKSLQVGFLFLSFPFLGPLSSPLLIAITVGNNIGN